MDTSWEKSADWYDKIIGSQGSELYQRIVIPGALRLLDPRKDEKILDLGCGQGVFSRALAEAGSEVTGVDASTTLIQKARSYTVDTRLRYLVRDAAKLRDLGPFDAISCILALQNMAHLDEVCRACSGALREGGRLLWVMNHPCFRIPRQTSWGFEEKVQYRRIDAYSTPMSIPIAMHPGQAQSETTTSFHHSLADLMRPAFEVGLVLSGMEEWHSDKISEPGPRARIENRARMEFPLFLALLWKKAGR
jgi:ubiquinone/menaquinone biosynthesis C-methylase UbiE